MITLADVAETLRTVLTSTAETIARETGFLRRQSKLGGARFVQTLVFGWLAEPEASLPALAQTAAALGYPVSAQAIAQRFTPEAADCLEHLLRAAVTTLVGAEPVAIPLLARFNGVYVQDSTTIRLPDALAEHWPGCGGSAPTVGQASLKLQVRLELRSGQLTGPTPEAGRAQDRASALQHAPLPAGALRLADLGYFSLPVLAKLGRSEAYWLSRYQVQTAVYADDGQRWERPALLAAQPGLTVDLPIRLGATEHLDCRLLAARVPREVATTRRRKLRKEAKREGETPNQVKLRLCDWTVLVTNVPAALLTVDEALVLGRARWQIELLFKLWKSHGRIDESRSAQPWRILGEVYAKLLAMVVQHWLVLVSCWEYPDRSLTQAARLIRKFALGLASTFAEVELLLGTLATLQRCLRAGGRIGKRQGDPATYQRLLHVTEHPSPQAAAVPAPPRSPQPGTFRKPVARRAA